MRKLMTAILAGAVLVASCNQAQVTDFDPADPVAIAEIDALLNEALAGAREADADRALAMAEGKAEFSFITGDLLLTGLETIREDFESTYSGIDSQSQTILERRIQLLAPDVAVFTGTSEGTYTDKAGWTSDLVGLGHTIIFVREDGKWRAVHAHQSIAK
jgi:uncharacterized protein (TIGR02246 family)